jgi:hypothetical protein
LRILCSSLRFINLNAEGRRVLFAENSEANGYLQNLLHYHFLYFTKLMAI